MQSIWEYLLLSLPGSVNGSHLFSGGDVARDDKRLGLKTTEKKPDSQKVGAAVQLGLSYEPGMVKQQKRLGSLSFSLNMLSLSKGLARNNLIHTGLFQHSDSLSRLFAIFTLGIRR